MLASKIKNILCLLLLFSVTTAAYAEPFRDGVVAYQQKNYKQALETWLPLAESGHVLAQTLVGSMYAYGEGVERNDEAAFKWLARAAEAGSSQAQYNLAILYENGFGTPTDKSNALKWFKAAAAQGRKEALTRYNALVNETTVPDTSSRVETKLKPAQQRVHMILNRDDTELLGPPSIKVYGQQWVNQQPQDNYTIQLAASIEPRLISAFKKHIQLDSEYADTLSTHNGREWHAVIYGSYPTVKEAKQAISQFPDNWKTWRPWIKKFSRVKHIKE